MKIEHMSVSRSQCYELCPYQYRYKYHLQMASDFPTPLYFDFGKIAHKVIEEHTKSRGEKSINLIKSEVLEGKVELEPGKFAPKLSPEDNTRLSKHLNNYLRLAEKIGYDGEVEWAFYCDIDAPNKRMLKGFIDRLIIKNNSAFIIDYKTTKPSKWRKDISTITKDVQLACYCWIVMTNFNIPAENIKAALYYLDDAKMVGAKFSEKTLVSTISNLSKLYKEIEFSDPDHVTANVGEHCRRCDYRNKCPHK